MWEQRAPEHPQGCPVVLYEHGQARTAQVHLKINTREMMQKVKQLLLLLLAAWFVCSHQ